MAPRLLHVGIRFFTTFCGFTKTIIQCFTSLFSLHTQLLLQQSLETQVMQHPLTARTLRNVATNSISHLIVHSVSKQTWLMFVRWKSNQPDKTPCNTP